MPPDSRIGPAATPGRSLKHSTSADEAESTVAAAAVSARLLAAALRYAPAWPVFPCKPDSKEPATAHGFKDASADPAQIRAWWRHWPDANIGIATGAPGPDVLDVDRHEDGDGFAAFNRLKRAGMLAGARALVRTRSGGLHAYFTGTGQPCGRLPAHHLDFKSSGGYVIAPPSVVGGKPYELLDHRPAAGRLDWAAVRSLLDPPRPAPARRRGDGGTARLAAWVAARPARTRNDGLFWAACRAAESGCDPGELLGAAMAAGLGEAEARRTIASAARRAGS
jgi:Bifunctional DNA primase/polymerase, N-terminal